MLPSHEEIVDFIYPNNPVWARMGATREVILNYIKQPHVHITIIEENDILMGVGVYLKDKIHVHFMSLTIRKGCNGVKVIRDGIRETIRKEKPKIISWLDERYRLKTKECD